MSEAVQSKVEKEVLRVALDNQAARDYAAMVERIKAANPCVKIHPSSFVSFLVSDFFETYFEKDMGILVAEFFDSERYCDAQREKAKGKPNYEEAIEVAAREAKRIKARRRRKVVRRKRQKPEAQSVSANENV